MRRSRHGLLTLVCVTALLPACSGRKFAVEAFKDGIADFLESTTAVLPEEAFPTPKSAVSESTMKVTASERWSGRLYLKGIVVVVGLCLVYAGCAPLPNRDFVILLHEMFIEGGTSRPNPLEISDFNILTMNRRVLPDSYPLLVVRGNHVRIRIGNLSARSHHPIHLHGHAFRVTATDGGPIPREGPWPETTVLVRVGSTRDIEFVADNPGDWIMHCHMTHRTMNQMGHDFPNMVGVNVPQELTGKIKKLLPEFMVMGDKGMIGMANMNMRVSANTIPMYGLNGQFGRTVFGGMAKLLKVREHATGYDDPGWYDFPAGSVARKVDSSEVPRDLG